MNEAIIKVENLTKKFGDFTAVDHINFEVKRGEIFGFLGPNGAGKSTTIRMLAALARPTEGTIMIEGENISSKNVNQIKKKIGLVAEKLIMYDYLTARENLRFFGHLYGLGGPELENHINELIKSVELWEWRNRQIGTFSTGMKQRVNIIRALITNPDIIFMDEPTLGLDPQSTRQIREFIRRLNSQGKTIILTTHIMSEADQLCDRVGIIDHGKIAALDTSENLKNKIKTTPGEIVEIELNAVTEPFLAKLKTLPDLKIQHQENNFLRLALPQEMGLDAVFHLAKEDGLKIMTIQTTEPSLEDVFIALTGRAMRDKVKDKVPMRSHGHGHGFMTPKSRIR